MSGQGQQYRLESRPRQDPSYRGGSAPILLVVGWVGLESYFFCVVPGAFHPTQPIRTYVGTSLGVQTDFTISESIR